MLHPLIVLLISFGSIHAQSYFAPNIYYSDVYASSTQSDSEPDYAVDADFFEEVPTCFSSDASQPDVEGFHWILIDFGIVISNIKEIRLVIEPDEPINKSFHYPIEAYVVSRLDVPKSELTRSATPKTSLPWSSAYFSLCNVSEPSSSASQAVTLQCPENYFGRWLAIRRRTQLNICLVNVYIERAFDECFEKQTLSTDRWFLGTVFRYVRHTPHETCRSSCMQASECEAVVFTKQRFSGICQLITGFRIHNSDQPDKLSDANGLLNCPAENCIIEMNYCHGGTSRQLEGRTDEMNGTNRTAPSSSTALQEEEWFVKKSKTLTSEQSMESVYVLSVVFEGLLECEVWDCGPVYVVVTDVNKTEQFCGTINTADVVKLHKAILFCNSTEPVLEPTSVRLRWYGQNVDPSQDSPQLRMQITGGRIRVSQNQPIPMTTTSTTTPVVITTKSSSTVHSRPIVPAVSTTPASYGRQFTEYGDNKQVDEFEQIIPSGPAEAELDDRSLWSEQDARESTGWLKAGEKQTYEFNYPLNDQQSQMREQQQQQEQQQQKNDPFASGEQPGQTVPAFSTSIPDRVYEKRNILIQSNSPSIMSRSATGNAMCSQYGVGLWTSFIVTVYLAWLYLF